MNKYQTEVGGLLHDGDTGHRLIEVTPEKKVSYFEDIPPAEGITAIIEAFPAVAHFHTIRVNQPAGWFYTTKALRDICDIWEKRGSGMTNMHGSTGDIVLLGTTTEQLEPIFSELTAKGFDLGGSGSDMRTPSCCNGQARCEWACYDSMGTCHAITQAFQDELHRPAFPYKFKMKFSACPNDCVTCGGASCSF